MLCGSSCKAIEEAVLSIWYSRKVPKEIVGEERESQIWRLDRARTVSSVLWPRLGSQELGWVVGECQ